MSTFVYLDTARLGQMCREAQAADRDFVRLAGEEGCSLYFEDFLHGGYFGGLSPRRRRRFPNLSGWEGLATLKRDLSGLATGGCEKSKKLDVTSEISDRIGSRA